MDAVRRATALPFRCLILLGGQRFKQMLRSTWNDDEAQTRVLTGVDVKGRRKSPIPHRFPISPWVAAPLDELLSFDGRGPYRFSWSAGKTQTPTATVSESFAALRHPNSSSHGVVPMQARDIRRSIKTRLQALGVERDVRAQLLCRGRSSGVQQRVDERHDFIAEKAAALETTPLGWSAPRRVATRPIASALRVGPDSAGIRRCVAGPGVPPRRRDAPGLRAEPSPKRVSLPATHAPAGR